MSEYTIPGGTRAPSMARQILREVLHGLVSPEALEKACLAASEVVTNGFCHGRASEDRPLRLRIERNRQVVRVSVTDPGLGSTTPHALEPDPTPGGFGLFIVEQLTERWGMERDDGTEVWFEVAA